MKLLIALFTLSMTVSCASTQSEQSKRTEALNQELALKQVQQLTLQVVPAHTPVASFETVKMCQGKGLFISANPASEIKSVYVENQELLNTSMTEESLFMSVAAHVPAGKFASTTVHIQSKNNDVQVYTVNIVNCSDDKSAANVPTVLSIK